MTPEKQKKEDLLQEVLIPQKKQVKYLGTIKPHKGHTLYELNLKNSTITIAQFMQEKVQHKLNEKNLSFRKKLIINPDCIYASALNIENAKKHFRKILQKRQTP